jgi:hypothetical protein
MWSIVYRLRMGNNMVYKGKFHKKAVKGYDRLGIRYLIMTFDSKANRVRQ